jgi:hypothetical protein
MEQNMKSLTEQRAIVAFILISVVILSFGIRHVRLSNHRANTIENPVVADTGEATSAHPSKPENRPKSQQFLDANTKPDHYPKDTYTVDGEPDPQRADAPDSDKASPSNGQSEAKSFKSDYAKTDGSKGLQKIFLSDHEDLYVSGEGELWYVSKQPDGSTTKMQVQIDGTTGEMAVVGGGNYAKSERSQNLQRIPLGDREDLYITPEGRTWYVTEGFKAQVDIDDTSGEFTVIKQYGDDK